MRAKLLAFAVFSSAVVLLPGRAEAAAAGDFVPAASSPVSVADSPHHSAQADFDGDGDVDMAVTSNLRLDVYANDGSAGFTITPTSPELTSTGILLQVRTADLDGDGWSDLVVTDLAFNRIHVLLNDGSGGFDEATGSPVASTSAPRDVAIVDLAGDGRPDLAATLQFADKVETFLGDGTGGFASAGTTATGTQPLYVATGDLNGDGFIDLAVTNVSSDSVSVLRNNGNQSFTAAALSVGFSPVGISAADLDGDGDPDLAVAAKDSDVVDVLLNDGTGSFLAAVAVPTITQPFGIAAADLDGDRDIDLAVSGTGTTNNVGVLLNDGSATFSAPATSPESAGAFAFAVSAVDVDSDNASDLIVPATAGDNVTILLNDSPIADLAITVDDGGVPHPVGDTFVYTLVVKNNGAATATGIAVTDELPVPDASYVSDDGGCSHSAGTVTCPVADLLASATATIHITVKADEACFPLNVASVRGDLRDPQFDNTAGVGSVFIAKVSARNVSRLEGDAGSREFAFKVKLNSPAIGGETIDFRTRPGTAEGNDYVSKSGSVVFAPGQQTAKVKVKVLGDRRFEPTETFFLELTNPLGLSVADARGRARIANDDPR